MKILFSGEEKLLINHKELKEGTENKHYTFFLCECCHILCGSLWLNF